MAPHRTAPHRPPGRLRLRLRLRRLHSTARPALPVCPPQHTHAPRRTRPSAKVRCRVVQSGTSPITLTLGCDVEANRPCSCSTADLGFCALLPAPLLRKPSFVLDGREGPAWPPGEGGGGGAARARATLESRRHACGGWSGPTQPAYRLRGGNRTGSSGEGHGDGGSCGCCTLDFGGLEHGRWESGGVAAAWFWMSDVVVEVEVEVEVEGPEVQHALVRLDVSAW
ncbi:hypothetical protein BJ546DRAFT_987359 [Cryomyces antarcticus]